MKKRVYVYYAIVVLCNLLLLILLLKARNSDEISFRLTTLGFVVAYGLRLGMVLGATLIFIERKNLPNFLYIILVALFDIVDALLDNSHFIFFYYTMFFTTWVELGSLLIQYSKAKKTQNANVTGYEGSGRLGNMSNNFVTSQTPQNGHTLKAGIVTLRFKNIRTVLIALCIISIIIAVLLLDTINPYILGGVLFLVLLALYLTLIFTNPLSNAIRKYLYKNIDYNGFIKVCENWKNTENLHDDTKSYITALEANVLAFEDQKQYKEQFASTVYPYDKVLNQAYSILRFSYCLNIRDFEQAQYLISIQNNSRVKENLIRGYTLYTTTDIIPNVEAYYRINTRSKFNNIVYAADLMRYYWTRGDKDRSKYYADFIRNQNTGYTYLTDLVNRVLNDEDIPDYNIYKSQDGE